MASGVMPPMTMLSIRADERRQADAEQRQREARGDLVGQQRQRETAKISDSAAAASAPAPHAEPR